MAFPRKLLRRLVFLACLAALISCSGMGPNGNGSSVPSTLDQTPNLPPNPNLGGGNLTVTEGTGANENVQSAAAPITTQQSEPGIGGPCRIHFKVRVHVLQAGIENRCDGEAAHLTRTQAAKILLGEAPATAELTPPPPPGPLVALTFAQEAIPEPRTERVETECASDGSWQSKKDDLFFYYIPSGIHCGPIAVKAQAEWEVGATFYRSNSFQGPPFSEDPNDSPFTAIDLSIDLGPGRFNSPAIAYPAH